MKELRGSRLFIIALVCGLIAAALLVFYMKQVESKYRQAAKPKQEAMVTVVVTRANMAKGERLTKKSIASRSVPEKYLPANAVKAKDYEKVINRTLLFPLQVGRPITWEAVTDSASRTFSEVLDLGKRGMTIKISRIDSFDGLLRPGDMIDLMGVFSLQDLGVGGRADSAISDEVVMPVLEKVRVIEASRQDLNGTNYEIKRDKNSVDGFGMEFTMVTVDLTPRQVARMQVAQGTGDIFAVLRHPKDTSLSEYEYLGVDLLLTEDAPEPVDLVLDASGKPVGRIVGDNVVDADGNIVGKVVNGKAVGFDGKALGQIVENVDPNDPINRVADIADVVRDADGNIIGRIVDGKVVDKAGNVIGGIKDGQPVGLDGSVLGTVERSVALDADGNEVNTENSVIQTQVQQVVRDADGNIIGTLVDGQVLNAKGEVVGDYRDGKLFDADGNLLSDGISVAGEVLVNVDEELNNQRRQAVTRTIRMVDFIAGGTGKEGVTPIQKIRVE